MANTLKFGNGQWATGNGTALAYNDENANFKPLPFDFTRASSGTVVNQSGLIETVGSGIPRIDFQGNTKGALLLEPSRTNLITYSEAFDNAYWTKSGTSVVSGFTSPDGTNNAFKLVEDTSGGAHFITTPITWSAVNNTFSIYAKSNGRNWIRLNTNDSTGNNLAWFNISNGTLGSKDAGITTSITLIADGWYRCSMTKTLTSFAGGATILIADADGSSTYTGNGTSGIYIFGAQLEQGSYPTSYIPTSGSAVTRVADECNNSANDQVINSSEGVLYAEVAGSSNDTVRYSISDGSNSNNIYIELSSSAVIAVGRLSAVNQFSIFSPQTITNYNKIAIKYKQNDFALWINGVEVGTDTSGNTYPTNTLDSLQFNRGDGGVDFYGNVKDVRVYNTALTDQELASLTQV
jgi:hypothetical protein